jgi:hypothetical protein
MASNLFDVYSNSLIFSQKLHFVTKCKHGFDGGDYVNK